MSRIKLFLVKVAFVFLFLCFTAIGSKIYCAELTWTQKANISIARNNHAVGVVNNKIYMIGGKNAQGYMVNAVEKYDPLTNIWTTKANMLTARSSFAVGVINNKIYAIGGLNNVEEYDTINDTWTTKANMPTARYGLAIGVVNNKIYAIGGSPYGLNKVEEYDPLNDTWTTKTNMPTGRWGLGVGVVNSKIYAIGGGDGLRKVEEYDPNTDTWTSKSDMPTGRYYFAIGVVDNKIYVIGGNPGGAGALDTVQEYDPSADSWSNKTDIPTILKETAGCTINNNIYVIGGDSGGQALDYFYEANVDTRSYILDHYQVITPTNVIVGTSFNMTVNAKNNTNDTIPNISETVNLKPLISGTTLQGTGSLGITSVQLTSGTATISNESYNKSGLIQIEASDSNGIKGLSNTIFVDVGSVSSISLNSNPGSIIKGQYSRLTATLADVYGTKAANKLVSFSVHEGSGTFNFSTLQSTGIVTDTNGEASVLLTVPNTVQNAQTDTVVASYGVLTATTIVSVSVLIQSASSGTVVATEDPRTRIIVPLNAFSTDITLSIKFDVDLSTGDITAVNNALSALSDKLSNSVIRSIEARKNSDNTVYTTGPAQLVTIELPYNDSNSDGIVDSAPSFNNSEIVSPLTRNDVIARSEATKQSNFRKTVSLAQSSQQIKTSALKVYRLNTTTNKFEIVNDGGINTVDTANNVVKAQVSKFGIFTIGSRAPASNLSNVKVYPNPFKPNIHTNGATIEGLTTNAKIKIFNIASELVQEASDANGDGVIVWDGKNSAGSLVASGVYIILIEGTGEKKRIKLGLIK